MTLNSLLQHHSLKASILQRSAFLMVQLSYLYMTIGKTIALTIWTFVDIVMWRLEAWNQGVDRAMLSLKALRSVLPCLSIWWFAGKPLVFLGLCMPPSSLCLHLCMAISSVFLYVVYVSNFLSSYKDISHLIRAHPTSTWIHHNLQRLYFQIRLYSQVARGGQG